jgi:4-amino-4-deoxy-L-arabinose transferase-like glycosyltransferase
MTDEFERDESMEVTPGATPGIDRVALICCLATVVLATLIGALHRVGTFGTAETDFYWAYGPQARNLLAGRPYGYPFQPPGYSLLLAAASFLTDDLFTAGKVLSAIATGIFAWLSYLLVKALFDARLALAIALLTLAALLPFSFLAATDVAGAALMLLPLWVLGRRPDPTLGTCLGAGMLSGAAWLVRANAIALILGLAVALLLGTRRLHMGRRLAELGVFLTGVLLTTVPTLRWTMHGQPFVSLSYLTVGAHFFLPGGEDNSITSLQIAARLFHSPWEVLSYDPVRLLRDYARDILSAHPRSLLNPFGRMGIPLAVVGGVGVLRVIRRPLRTRLAWFITSACMYLLLGLTGFQARYYIFLFPMLFLPVASGAFQMSKAASRLRRGALHTTPGWALVAILVASLGVRSLGWARQVIRDEPRYLLRLAAALRVRASPDDGIIVRKPHLAYLAGLRLVEFPLAEDAGQFLAAAKQGRARYVVYSDREARQWPGLRSLAEPSALPEEFRLIYRDDSAHALIYEIRSVAGQGSTPNDGLDHREH